MKVKRIFLHYYKKIYITDNSIVTLIINLTAKLFTPDQNVFATSHETELLRANQAWNDPDIDRGWLGNKRPAREELE